MPANNFPKLHNAMWPGLVGKGSPGAEPCIELDTMLDLTTRAEVGGVKFDGVDLFLYKPHTDIDISDDGIKALAAKIAGRGLTVGSVVAPVWFDASAMGDETKRANWLTHVRKACRIAQQLRKLGQCRAQSRSIPGSGQGCITSVSTISISQSPGPTLRVARKAESDQHQARQLD